MFGIDDALLGAFAGPLIGGLLGGAGGGSSQGGTTTQKNEPWGPAQPWLQNNLQTGQNLQNYYQRSPFSQHQQAAYENLAAGTDRFNSMVPGLLWQFSQPGGFDRNNPTARPQPFNLLGDPNSYSAMRPSMPRGDMNVTSSHFANGGIQAPAAPSPAAGPLGGPMSDGSGFSFNFGGR